MKPRPYSRPYTDTVFAPLAVRVAEIEANVRAVLDAPVAPDLSHRLHARAALLHIRALRAALAAGDVGAAADAALQLGAEAELLHATPWIDAGEGASGRGHNAAEKRWAASALPREERNKRWLEWDELLKANGLVSERARCRKIAENAMRWGHEGASFDNVRSVIRAGG